MPRGFEEDSELSLPAPQKPPARRKQSRINALITLCVASSWLATTNAATVHADAVTETGDVIQIVLPAVGWASTFVAGTPGGDRWDREGTWQATKSIGGALITQRAWKVIAKKLRPSGGARSSFPSGHTTGAFSGAAFLDMRYGWKIGIPSYAAAGFVGYSRVRADAHFADDVTAGASIALLFGWLFVTPQDTRPLLTPVLSEGGVGVQINSGGETGAASRYGRPRYAFTFAFGPSYLIKNEIGSPKEGGTRFNLNTFEKIDDPTTTSAVTVDVAVKERQHVAISWNPYESRDRGTFATPVEFGGKVLPANTRIGSAWRLYDVRGRWGYDLVASDAWDVELGVGASYQHLSVGLRTEDLATEVEVRDWLILPYLHGHLEGWFTQALSAAIDVEGARLPEDWMVDAVVYASYRFGPRWKWSAGYQFYDREISTDDLFNRVAFDVPYLAVTYLW